MALTPTSHKVPVVASGNSFLTLLTSGSKHVQSVATVDDSGDQSGIEDNPFHVAAIDFAHFEIHEGDSYYYHDVITLGSAATQNYVLTVPDATSWPHISYSVEGIYGVTVELFEGGDRTPTTAQTVFNRQRNSLSSAGMTIHKGFSAGTTDGTRIVWRKSGSGTSGGKLAGVSRDATERVLKQNTQYILRITSAAASNDISVELDWYEHGLA